MRGTDTLRALGGATRKLGSVAVQAARHVAWYIEHQVQGAPRDAPRRRRGGSRRD